jgi:hypothetical protein
MGASLRRDWSAAGKDGVKLISRVELQLAEDAREVTLDRPCGYEEGLGDLSVAVTLAGEFGDTALAGRQGVEPREHDPARAGAGRTELSLRVLGEGWGAGAVGGVESLAEELPRFGAAIPAPKHCAEVGERTCALKPGVATLERGDGLTEQRRSTVTAGDDAGGAQSHAECARGSECLRELKLFFGQAFRRFVIAEREMGERGL